MGVAGGKRRGGTPGPGEPDPQGVAARHPGWLVTCLPGGAGYRGERARDGTVLTGKSPESLEGKIIRADVG